MKTYIDLLPEGKKEEIKKEKAVRTIIGQEIGLAFLVVFLIAILAAINFVLKIQVKIADNIYQNEQAMTGSKELNAYEDKFREVNTRLEVISKVQENHLEWVGALTKLSQLFPDGVSVSGIATKEYRVFLIGKAQKREDLLKLQEVINTSECFVNINAPLSNLVSKENIDFQIDFDIKKECLKVK